NLAVITVFVLGCALTWLPILEEARPYRFIRPLGYALAVMCTLFLFGHKLWSPGRTLIPAAACLLVMALWNTHIDLRWYLVAAGASVFTYLVMTAGSPQWTKLAWLTIFAVGFAWAGIVVLRD